VAQKYICIREATSPEDSLIAKHFFYMWRDNGVSDELIEPDWLDITLQFIEQARRHLSYKAFFAEVDSEIVGSASCQIFAGLYPNILKDEYRKYGYIWGVYVEPHYRKQGIGKQLTSAAIAHLQAIGCTRAVLNASPSGKPIYDSLGFSNGNVMHLDLI
jgi:ribosomal protein S18 acetylase RimI-like enzyme